MKKLKEVIKRIEEFATPELASFDFVGLLQGDTDQHIKKIGLTLDYDFLSIQQAIKEGCDLLITHHGPTEIKYPLRGNLLDKITVAAKNNLSVYRCHLNLDFCNGGIIETLCQILEIPAKSMKTQYAGMKIEGGVFLAENYPMTFAELQKRVRNLHIPSFRVAGKKKDNFSRIAVTSGQGFISEFFDQLKPDIYIAGEFEQEAIKYATDLGIMLVELSHHASEFRALEKIAPKLSKKLGVEVMLIEQPDTIENIFPKPENQ